MAKGAKIGLASGGILLCESSDASSNITGDESSIIGDESSNITENGSNQTCSTESTTRLTTATQINPVPTPMVDFPTKIAPVSSSEITKISEFTEMTQINNITNHVTSFFESETKKGFSEPESAVFFSRNSQKLTKSRFLIILVILRIYC